MEAEAARGSGLITKTGRTLLLTIVFMMVVVPVFMLVGGERTTYTKKGGSL